MSAPVRGTLPGQDRTPPYKGVRVSGGISSLRARVDDPARRPRIVERKMAASHRSPAEPARRAHDREGPPGRHDVAPVRLDQHGRSGRIPLAVGDGRDKGRPVAGAESREPGMGSPKAASPASNQPNRNRIAASENTNYRRVMPAGRGLIGYLARDLVGHPGLATSAGSFAALLAHLISTDCFSDGAERRLGFRRQPYRRSRAS